MPEGFVKIRSYWSPDEANLAKIHLEAHGIPVELEGAMMVATAWIDANAIGGVKLLVSRDDAEQATEILESHATTRANKSIESDGAAAEWQTGDGAGDDLTENGDDGEVGGGVLTNFRSLKGPFIWFFLAMSCGPFLLWLAWTIACLLRLPGTSRLDF